MIIGLIGKANVGKSTFFNAATELAVPAANYPFTTLEPNVGVAYARVKCVCREFGVQDNPVHSMCIDGNRFIPVKLVDVPDSNGNSSGSPYGPVKSGSECHPAKTREILFRLLTI